MKRPDEPARSRAAAVLLAAAALSCAGARTGGGGPAPESPPVLQLPADVRPVRYALDLEVVPARAEGFSGRAEIEVVLDRPRSVLWLNGQGLEVTAASVETPRDGRVAAVYTEVAPVGVARLALPRAIGPGPATVRVAWKARWTPEGGGPFRRLEGDDAYAVTQFEAAEARRAFPCFDEPRFKTPFELTLTVPEGTAAIANAPEAGSDAAGPGLRRVRFAPTAPLPTYLAFWTVGPYELVDATVPPNEVRARPLPARIVVPRGRGGETAFARETSAEIVTALERWFGAPFPYAKLDHVAVPGLAFAMENAGAIVYGDEFLLFDPATPARQRARRGALALAHEVAHQWFGDLVTLPWWTDVWLNESFADWIAIRTVARLKPEWRVEVYAVDRTANALAADALPGVRAIRRPLERLEEVDAQFDSLSYEKGAALLAMFERLAGSERFREGVRSYVAAHAHGTGSTRELLDALSRAAGRDLAAPFATFLDAPGAPLVRAEVECGGSAARVTLRQSRYAARGSDAPAGAGWQVPVCLRYAASGAMRERCTLLAEPSAIVDLPEGCPEWLLPNAGGAGYYVWTLAPAHLARLRQHLAALTAPELVAFAQSVEAAHEAAAIPYDDAMDALLALAGTGDPDAAAEAMAPLQRARDVLVAPADRGWVEAVARRTYRATFDRVGWDPRGGETLADARFRARLAQHLVAIARDPEVRREASRRGAAWLGLDAPPRENAIDPELLVPALVAAVDEHGAPAVDAVVARLAATPDRETRLRLAGALAGADEPKATRRFAELARGGPVQPFEWLLVLTRMRDPHRVEAALPAFEAALDGWLATLPSNLWAYLPTMVAGLCDEAGAERVRSTFAPRVAVHPQLAPFLAETLERIRRCSAARAADAAPATAYFRARAR